MNSSTVDLVFECLVDYTRSKYALASGVEAIATNDECGGEEDPSSVTSYAAALPLGLVSHPGPMGKLCRLVRASSNNIPATPKGKAKRGASKKVSESKGERAAMDAYLAEANFGQEFVESAFADVIARAHPEHATSLKEKMLELDFDINTGKFKEAQREDSLKDSCAKILPMAEAALTRTTCVIHDVDRANEVGGSPLFSYSSTGNVQRATYLVDLIGVINLSQVSLAKDTYIIVMLDRSRTF